MFVSPLYVSDKIVENLPRMRFFFGEKDESRDDLIINEIEVFKLI